MQTSLIAVESFSGLQGNSSQVCYLKKTVKLFNISLKVSIQMYFFDVKLIGFGPIFCSKAI